MPKFEQIGLDRSDIKKPEGGVENPDAEKRIAIAKEAELRREGEKARESLKRAFEDEGLDREEKPEEERREVAA